jgi:hypothetical protein
MGFVDADKTSVINEFTRAVQALIQAAENEWLSLAIMLVRKV